MRVGATNQVSNKSQISNARPEPATFELDSGLQVMRNNHIGSNNQVTDEQHMQLEKIKQMRMQQQAAKNVNWKKP